MSYDRPNEPPTNPEQPRGSEHQHPFPVSVDVAHDGTVTLHLGDGAEGLKIVVRNWTPGKGRPDVEAIMMTAASEQPRPGVMSSSDEQHLSEVCIYTGWPPGRLLACVKLPKGPST